MTNSIDLYQQVLNKENIEEVSDIFSAAVRKGLEFKIREKIFEKDNALSEINSIVSPLAKEPQKIQRIAKEFENQILPYCTNENHENFCGFPDTGDSVGGMLGGLYSLFLQQNLINQSFDSPSATLVEIAVIQWLREAVNYNTSYGTNIQNVWEVGGIITAGGTMSNTVAMMLARENYQPNTMNNGVYPDEGHYLIVPKGIGHYSVKSAQMWVGCGSKLIEVETKDYKYDLKALEKTLKKYKGKVMAVIAYVGDSRTTSIDDLKEIAKITKSIDKNIWLHADACHGFLCGFSDRERHKLDGIEGYDSITVDPHKVMLVPYTVSALLVKNPNILRTVSSYSDLIMQEDLAFGQVTPFIGSKAWSSLKLWMMMKQFGKEGLASLVEHRIDTATQLYNLLSNHPNFIPIHKPDFAACSFIYVPEKRKYNKEELDGLNSLNKQIHTKVMQEGVWHLHQFSVPDAGRICAGEIIHPLRFMAGNLRLKQESLNDLVAYVSSLGNELCDEFYNTRKIRQGGRR